MTPETLLAAISAVRSGGILAYPTEAVFGLGCDPRNEAAVRNVLDLKRRPQEKGFIIVASNLAVIGDLIDTTATSPFTEAARTPAFATWCWPALDTCPEWLRGENPSIAIRIPAWMPLRRLLEATGPLLSTSANRSGEPACTDAACVRRIFGEALDLVIDTPVGGEAAPSPVRDVCSGERFR